MTENEYRSRPEISRSELWMIRESPEKFLYKRANPEPPTPALLFGIAAHKYVLEEQDFWNDFVLAPSIDRRTKAGKEEYAAFMAQCAGKQIITAEQWEQIREMGDTIKCNGIARQLLMKGIHELPAFWVDEATGERCKCRFDCVTAINGQPVIVDYKTANNASTEEFTRAAVKYGYDFQAAMYSAGYAATNDGAVPMFVFIVQEKEPPYSINILAADDDFVAHGEETFRELLGIYHHCNETGNWWGYMGEENTINTLSLPAWMTDKKGEKNGTDATDSAE